MSFSYKDPDLPFLALQKKITLSAENPTLQNEDLFLCCALSIPRQRKKEKEELKSARNILEERRQSKRNARNGVGRKIRGGLAELFPWLRVTCFKWGFKGCLAFLP